MEPYFGVRALSALARDITLVAEPGQPKPRAITASAPPNTGRLTWPLLREAMSVKGSDVEQLILLAVGYRPRRRRGHVLIAGDQLPAHRVLVVPHKTLVGELVQRAADLVATRRTSQEERISAGICAQRRSRISRSVIPAGPVARQARIQVSVWALSCLLSIADISSQERLDVGS